MSKLAIFFCIIFFVSATNAGVFSVPTTNPELNNEIVKANISELQRKSRDNDRIAQKLSILATESSLKIREEIWFLNLKVKADIEHLINQAKGPGISRCTTNFEHLNNIARNITLETSQCVADKLITGLNQVVDIDELLKNAMDGLTAIKTEPQKDCNSFCQTLTVDASWNSEKKIKKIYISPEFATELAEKKTAILHKFEQETFQPSLNNCLNNGLHDFHHKSSAVVNKTTKCIYKIRSFTDEHVTPA